MSCNVGFICAEDKKSVDSSLTNNNSLGRDTTWSKFELLTTRIESVLVVAISTKLIDL